MQIWPLLNRHDPGRSQQDHRGVKSRLVPMLGLKGFRTAATAITGIDELLRRIHKDQFDLGELRLKNGVRPLSGRRSARTLTEPLN
jgi:hypothetical protein